MTVALRDCYQQRGGLLQFVKSGSKGSLTHHAQMTKRIGQRYTEKNKVFSPVLAHGTRFFSLGEDKKVGQGYIRNCYAVGLQPLEYLIDAMVGRESISAIHTCTSVSGYMQRLLVKRMEDITLGEDGMARDSSGRVFFVNDSKKK